MVNLQLDWQQSSCLAVGLVATRSAVVQSSRTSRFAPYLVESAIIAGLYALWQLAASVSVLGTNGALDRGRWIEHFQRDVQLPSERSIQHLIDGHPLVAQACNLYYAGMHFGVLGVFLPWLFIRHRGSYALVRNVLVLFTAMALVIQLLPVAPPRLLPDLGFVDVAAQYGQSVYNLSGITVDELAAMPSVHVGWALLVAWAVIRVSPSRYRWWVVIHPALTIFVVVATANHFWLDGIVAAALVVLSNIAIRSVMRSNHRDARGSGRSHGGEGRRGVIEADLAGEERVQVELAGGDRREEFGIAVGSHAVTTEPAQFPPDKFGHMQGDRTWQ
jgi:membrane protein implicated in regulation of membrane protease activity